METSEGSKNGIGEQVAWIKKAFEHANKIADAVCPESGEQREEGTFESEHLSLGVKHVENALMIYAVPFQKQILKLVMDNFPAKEEKHNQEVRRQEADNALLNAITGWSVEKVEKLTNILKNLVL
jgi:hypothetical protein